MPPKRIVDQQLLANITYVVEVGQNVSVNWDSPTSNHEHSPNRIPLYMVADSSDDDEWNSAPSMFGVVESTPIRSPHRRMELSPGHSLHYSDDEKVDESIEIPRLSLNYDLLTVDNVFDVDVVLDVEEEQPIVEPKQQKKSKATRAKPQPTKNVEASAKPTRVLPKRNAKEKTKANADKQKAASSKPLKSAKEKNPKEQATSKEQVTPKRKTTKDTITKSKVVESPKGKRGAAAKKRNISTSTANNEEKPRRSPYPKRQRQNRVKYC
ncbi:hypothetical protein M3Y95_00417900 [Aphelenchoides besseyi]|nr:hypothetical protein M3Y95_00417900 [Aphelenchoides besseyi]